MEIDILESKLSKSIQKSQLVTHRKTMALFSSIKSEIGVENSKGLKGVKLYTKKVFELLPLIFEKISQNSKKIFEDDLLNIESLLLVLTILLKNLDQFSIRKVFEFNQNTLRFLSTFLHDKSNVEIKRYILLITERILVGLEDELTKDNILVNLYLDIIENILKQRNENSLRDLTKSLTKLLKSSSFVKFSESNFILKLKNLMIGKLKGIQLMNVKNSEISEFERVPGIQITPLQTNESEDFLKMLSGAIQFLSIEIVHEIILEMLKLLDINNGFILYNLLLCIEVSFSSKIFSVELTEKFIETLIINYKYIINFDSFDERIIITYSKTLSQVLISLSNRNTPLSLKYAHNVIALLSEFLLLESDFVKSVVGNSLLNIVNQVFSEKNLQILSNFASNSNQNNEITLDDLNLSAANSISEFKRNFEKTISLLLDLTSSRYSTELKHTYEILYSFMSRISKAPIFKNYNENIIRNVSMVTDSVITSNNSYKIFVAKLFNIENSKILLSYFPIQCMDFDLTSEDFTDESRVWLISYLSKFMKHEGTLSDFFEAFNFLLEELENCIEVYKNKGGNVVDNDIEMTMEEANDSAKIKELKLKRYEQIYLQVWSLLPNFSNFSKNDISYLQAFLTKMNKVIKIYPEAKTHFFKAFFKITNLAVKNRDTEIMNLIRKPGKIYLENCLDNLTNLVVKKDEMALSFQLISVLSKVLTQDVIFEKICNQILKFEESHTNLQNNQNQGNAKKNEMVCEKSFDKFKERQRMEFRVEIVIYLTKQTNFEEKLMDLLFSFFNKYFFKESEYKIRKQFLNLFLVILEKIKDFENLFKVYIEFSQSKGIELISSKQKSKILDFVNKRIIAKLETLNTIDKKDIEHYYFKNILLEIVLLTKDMNRKVRNMSYDMIAEITDFMSSKGLFEEWIKMNLSLLTSQDSSMKSAGLYSLARVFWQKRQEFTQIKQILKGVFDIVKMLFKENDKEISKAIFLFLRVYLYIIDDQTLNDEVQGLINCIFVIMKNEIREEFKVKIRNLLKCLCIKLTYEKLFTMIPESHQGLLNYINKHIIKKLPKTHEKNHDMLDHDIDYTDIDIDEEEEFISAEFKKVEKKNKDEESKFLEKIENLELNEGEMPKPKVKAEPKDKKLQQIEDLFNEDKVNLGHHFYVNPYANDGKKIDKEDSDEEKNDEVYFDARKGKVVVKLDKGNRREKSEEKKFVKKRGRDETEENETTVKKQRTSGKSASGHIIKYSGDEYKAKKGKGDVLLKGKPDPFAYIQLNPKTTSRKNRKEGVKTFESYMKKSKGSLTGGLKITK